MFFCPNCGTILDITKQSAMTQKGGSVENIIEKILNNIEFDVDDVTLESLTKSDAYKKIEFKEQKDIVYNAIKDKLNKSTDCKVGRIVDTSYHICQNCGYNSIIKDNTLIFEKGTDTSKYEGSLDYEQRIYDNKLPRTRYYECKNKKCPSYDDFTKREAVFFRTIPKEYTVRYVCCACKTTWLN